MHTDIFVWIYWSVDDMSDSCLTPIFVRTYPAMPLIPVLLGVEMIHFLPCWKRWRFSLICKMNETILKGSDLLHMSYQWHYFYQPPITLLESPPFFLKWEFDSYILIGSQNVCPEWRLTEAICSNIWNCQPFAVVWKSGGICF